MSGKYAGQSGLVINRIGKKSLSICLNPMTVVLRESSVKYVTEDKKNDGNICSDHDVIDPPTRFLATPSTDKAVSVADESNLPSQSSRVCIGIGIGIGTQVVLIGGTYRGRVGVVEKLHPKMVTIKLSATNKSVRVWQHNVKVNIASKSVHLDK
jgi:hypothetical protein